MGNAYFMNSHGPETIINYLKVNLKSLRLTPKTLNKKRSIYEIMHGGDCRLVLYVKLLKTHFFAVFWWFFWKIDIWEENIYYKKWLQINEKKIFKFFSPVFWSEFSIRTLYFPDFLDSYNIHYTNHFGGRILKFYRINRLIYKGLTPVCSGICWVLNWKVKSYVRLHNIYWIVYYIALLISGLSM